jgi:perosamine synthetase
MGDISATSFYANKIISTGEGGMVLTDNDEYAERARSYRNLCFIPGKRFMHSDIGYNFRMTNLQAAVGVAQVEQIDRFIGIKKRLWGFYRDQLSDVQGLRFMSPKNWARSVYWMYCVELDAALGVTADDLMSRLKIRGIGTRPFFRGLHDQPALEDTVVVKDGGFPNADFSYRFGFYLPSGMSLSEADIDRVAQTLKEELNP